MTTHPFFVRLRFLRIYTSIVCFCFVQSVSAQLEISSSVPTSSAEALHVGVGTAQFELEIFNSSSPQTIETIEINQPVGVRIVSAEYELNGMTYPAPVTEHTISVNTVLQSSQHMKITYHKTANCEVIPQATSGFSVSVIDNISVITDSYTEQVESNSYPVLFPGLIMNTPESPNNNIEVEYREYFTDSIEIKNAARAGSVQNMIVTMKWETEELLTIDNMQIAGVGSVPFDVTGNTVAIEIDKTILTDIGFADSTLHADSSLLIIPTFFAEDYFPSLKTTYIVDYRVDNEVCTRLENAMGIVYYTQQYPVPEVTISRFVENKANYCGQKFKATYTITPLSDSIPSHYLLDTYVDFINNGFIVESVIFNGQVLSDEGGRYYLNNGIDLDGNSQLSDYDGSGSFEIQVIASPIYNETVFNHRIFFRFWGEKINGDAYVMTSDTYERTKTANSYASGDATLDDRTHPIGNFTFDYTAKVENAKYICMDYDVYVKLPDGSLSLASGNNGVYNGSYSSTLTACQQDILTFKLVVETEGCPGVHTTLTQATPNTVQRCHEGSGGSCYVADVSSATLSPKVINTCNTAELTANGEVSYICGSRCPKYESIVVCVYDNTEQLDFELLSPELNGTQPTQQHGYQPGANIHAVSYEFPFSQDCQDLFTDTTDTILNVKYNFHGEVQVNEHFSKNRVDANIQVRYILIDENGTLYDATWTWGDILTVYDPKPKISASTRIWGCSNSFVSVEQSAKAPGSNTGNIKVLNITYPGEPDFYYNNRGIEGLGDDYTYAVNQVVEPSNREVYSTPIYSVCVEDGRVTPANYGEVEYVDFYGTECEETVKEHMQVLSNLPMDMPTLTLHPTETQQNVEEFTTWTVQVENTGRATAENVTLQFQVDPDNVVDLGITDINGDFIFGTKTEYYTVGSIPPNTQTEVTIQVQYNECTAQDTSNIFVRSAWACEPITESNFETYACDNPTDTLKLENLVAVLSATETFSDESFNLCEDIPVSFTIDNIGRANLNQLGVWFEDFPSNYSLTDDKINWNFGGENGSLVDGYVDPDFNDIISLFNENTFISKKILSTENDSTSALEGTAPTITMDFDVQLQCPKDDASKIIINAYPPLKFKVSSVTNCDAIQEKYFSYKPNIIGFESLDSIQIQGYQKTVFETYQDTALFTARIKNNSSVLIDSAYISVIIPNDYVLIDYIPLREGTVVGLTQTPYTDSTTVLQWELTKQTNIQAHDSILIDFRLQAIAECSQPGYIEYYGTLKRMMQGCEGDSCLVSRSTDPVSIPLNPQNPDFSATISGNESVCTDNTAHYEVTGVGIQSVSWNLTPESIGVLTENGLRASVLYSETGTATVTATVVGQCESRDLTVQTRVLTVPVVSIDPAPPITWKGWSEQGVSIIDNTLPAENWQVPTIDTCGIYELVYTETNQCGTATQTVPIEIIHCCDTIVLELADTISIDDWNAQQEALIAVSPTNGTWTSVPAIIDCGTYTLVYTVTNECDTVHKEIMVEIDGCCVPEEINMPADTLTVRYAEWLIFNLNSIGVSPAGGTWQTLYAEPHNMCGEYVYEYTIETCGSVDKDTIVIVVEDCCTIDPEGDIAITEMEGVTTFDVEVLEYYINHPESVIQVEDAYETYYMEMIICGELVRIELVQCFPKWANIDGIGEVNNADVEALKYKVE